MTYVLKQEYNPKWDNLGDMLDSACFTFMKAGDIFSTPEDKKWMISDYVYVRVHPENKWMFDIQPGFIGRDQFPDNVIANLMECDYGMMNNSRIILDESVDATKSAGIMCVALDSNGTCGKELMIDFALYGEWDKYQLIGPKLAETVADKLDKLRKTVKA